MKKTTILYVIVVVVYIFCLSLFIRHRALPLPDQTKKYDIVFATHSVSDSAIAQILENIKKTLSKKYNYKIHVLYGFDPRNPPSQNENFIMVSNDFLNVFMDLNEQKKVLQPWLLLGCFPLVLTTNDQGPTKSFEGLLKYKDAAGNINFLTNSFHPIGSMLAEQLKPHFQGSLKFKEIIGIDPFIRSIISYDGYFSFISQLTVHDYIDRNTVIALATTKPTRAFPNVVDLSKIYPKLGVTQNVIAYFDPKTKVSPLIKARIEEAVFGKDFDAEIAKYSTTKPTSNETIIQNAIKENYELYLKYKAYRPMSFPGPQKK